MEIYIISMGSASIAVSTMVGTAKKIMQFGIFVFAEAQEINLRGNLQGSKCDGDCRFTKKFLPLLTLSDYFRNILIPTLSDVFH